MLLFFWGAPSHISSRQVVEDHKKEAQFPEPLYKQTEHLLKAFGHCLDVEDLLKGVSCVFIIS